MKERIVVGFEGKDTSVPALAWAAHEARLRDGLLEVIYAWARTQHAMSHPEEDLEEAREAVRAGVEAQIRDLIGGGPDIELEITISTDDRPAHALTEASDRADVLVIGSRGLSPAKGHVLGSVGQQLIESARCPLVIIPPKGRERATEQFTRDQLELAKREAGL